MPIKRWEDRLVTRVKGMYDIVLKKVVDATGLLCYSMQARAENSFFYVFFNAQCNENGGMKDAY